MLTVNANDLPIDRTEVLRYLGYKPEKRKARNKILRLLDEEIARARTLINPRGLYRILDAYPLREHRMFHDAEKIAFGICTIGEKLEQEVKRLFKSGEATRGVLLDAVGSVSAEAVTDLVNEEIEKWSSAQKLHITRRFSPGYSGWNVRDQKLVFKYLEGSTAGVSLTPSGIMMPIKSVSFACKMGSEQMEEINKGEKCSACSMRSKCLYKSGERICLKTAQEA